MIVQVPVQYKHSTKEQENRGKEEMKAKHVVVEQGQWRIGYTHNMHICTHACAHTHAYAHARAHTRTHTHTWRWANYLLAVFLTSSGRESREKESEGTVVFLMKVPQPIQ